MTDKSRGDQASFALLNSGEQATSASGSGDRLNRTDKGEHITAEPAQTVREGVPASGEQAMATRIHKVSLSTKKFSSRCRICSNKRIIGYKTKKVKHKHFCSKYYRDCFVSSEAPNTKYYCQTCKKFHGVSLNERLKICIASSNLHEFWNPSDPYFKYEGDSSHIDYITIPGARINQLTVAWEVQYGTEKRGMDIILVGGLLNITRGYEAESVMRAYKHFVDLVEWQAERFHPDVKNTCTIAPLPYPPKLCWLQGNGPLPDNYVNKYNMIRGINNEIEAGVEQKVRHESSKFHNIWP